VQWYLRLLFLQGDPLLPVVTKIIDITVALAFFLQHPAHLCRSRVNGHPVRLDLFPRQAIRSFIGEPGCRKLKKVPVLPAKGPLDRHAGQGYKGMTFCCARRASVIRRKSKIGRSFPAGLWPGRKCYSKARGLSRRTGRRRWSRRLSIFCRFRLQVGE